MNTYEASDALIWSWCMQQLAVWQTRRVDKGQVFEEMHARNKSRPMEFLFNIDNGTVTIEEKSPQTPDRVPIWRPPLYLRFLSDVVSLFCPDLTTKLLVNVSDGNLDQEQIPVFTFQKILTSNTILLPDVDFLEYEFYYSNNNFYDSLSYSDKSCSAVFVGSTTGGIITPDNIDNPTHPRLKSALYFKENKDVDFRLPVLTNESDEIKAKLRSWGFGAADKLTYHEQFRHKFLISMDGWGATCSRLPISLRSSSTLLKYDSPYQLYYFSGLTPWLHFIPIHSDKDVETVIAIEQNRPGIFESVARQGTRFANEYLTRLQAMKYTAWLLRAYVDCFEPIGTGEGLTAQLMPKPVLKNVVNNVVSRSDVAHRPDAIIAAHFATHGDKWFQIGEWVEHGDHAPIEGIIVELSPIVRPMEIEYRVVLHDGTLSDAATGGMYCGTRGKARAISGFMIQVTGPLSALWELEYTAKFNDGSYIGPCRQGTLCRAQGDLKLTGLNVQFVPVIEASVARPPYVIPATDDREHLRQLFMSFESLGGTGHGCEFGLVQRHYGAEPLGLLRWADLGFEQLITALKMKFEGVGHAEHTAVFCPEHSQEEYWTLDRRYHMAMRTFVTVSDVPFDTMVVNVNKRLSFLREKLLQDLSENNKIFVYKNLKRNLSRSELDMLSCALRNYGPNILLYIALVDHERSHGVVERIAPGRYVGYISRFTFSADDQFLGPSQELFLDVCRNCMRIARNDLHNASVSA